MIAGGLAQWQQRIRTASPAELASLDQQVGPTHPLRPLITEEVVTRANQQSGVGPEPQPVPAPEPEFEPQQIPMTSAVVNPPAVPDIPIPAAPAPNPAAPQASLPQPVPTFYNAGDRQTVRDVSSTMDRLGAASGEVVTDVAAALRDTATDAASIYDQYMPRIVEATGDVLAGWKDAASSTYDQWMPRLTGTGYPEPPVNSILDVQTGASGASPETRPGMVGALMGPQPGMEFKPPAAPYTLALPAVPGATSTATAATATPSPATVPGGPPPPADPSPLSQVTVAPPRRKPDIPVKAPPRQTTKSAAVSDGPSAAEALNRFYADQYRQGHIPGAPATVEDARTMAGMGDLKGAYR
jgi:hypothetical protein